MSSYKLMAKLRNIESATTDLEDSIAAINNSKQDKLKIAGSGINSYPLMTYSNVIKGFQADFFFTMTNNTDTNVLELGFQTDLIEVTSPISKTITNHSTIKLGLAEDIAVNTIRPKAGTNVTVDGKLAVTTIKPYNSDLVYCETEFAILNNQKLLADRIGKYNSAPEARLTITDNVTLDGDLAVNKIRPKAGTDVAVDGKLSVTTIKPYN